LAENIKAQQEEVKAFNKMKKKLGAGATAFAQPAGFATAFPDFGFRIIIDGKKVDIHVEYKADSKAQMGSMRDWQFDGKKFITPNPTPEKTDLIKIMNESPDCLRNGKRLLKDFKTYVDPGIKSIYSGMLSIEPDKKIRKIKMEKFVKGTSNYQLANIDNVTMGDHIITHYKNKFNKEVKKDADYSILLMMLGDSISLVATKGTANAEIKKRINQALGVPNIPKLVGLKAKLEVRIQPRGMTGGSKPPSIDVMASFRLSGKPPGVTI
jgi:hypothetical protein